MWLLIVVGAKVVVGGVDEACISKADGMWGRERLRRLEAALANDCGFPAAGAQKHRRVVLMKTHKTASSTIERVISMAGVGLGASFAESVMNHGDHLWRDAECPKRLERWVNASGCFEMSVRHVYPRGQWWPMRDCPTTEPGRWFFEAYEMWRKVFGEDVAVVLPIRDPASHLESVIHYYGVAWKKYDEDQNLWNPLSQDLHLRSISDIQALRRHFEIAAGLLVVPLERLDEALVVLRRRFQWSFRDVIPLPLVHPVDQQKGQKKISKPSTLVRDRLPETLELDVALYDVLLSFYEKRRREVDGNSGTVAEEALALKTVVANLVDHAFPALSGIKNKSNDYPELSRLQHVYTHIKTEKRAEAFAAASSRDRVVNCIRARGYQ